MYAVVVIASIGQGQFESAQKSLRDDAVPRIRQANGFIKGYWTINADRTQGISMTVYDTKENAESAAAMGRNMAPPAGVTLNNVEVREIVAEA